MELPNGSGHWSRMHLAFEKRDECERLARGAYDFRARMDEEPAKRGEKIPAAFFACLPDTVDPRGSKAK